MDIAKEWVSEIIFSPNNKWVAMGSHDNSIYIYKIQRNDD